MGVWGRGTTKENATFEQKTREPLRRLHANQIKDHSRNLITESARTCKQHARWE